MPHTLLGAFELMDGDADAAAVQQLIETDPAVATRMLRVANSAFAGPRAEVTSLKRAIVMIGPTSALGLVMSMGMVEMKKAFDAEVAAPYLEIVRHSIATATIAQRIAEDRDEDADQAAASFAAGLLHDLGKLVLLYASPTQAGPLYRDGTGGQALLEREESQLGTTHVRMGAALVARLRLPETIGDVIRSHHEERPDASLAVRIARASAIARWLGFPAGASSAMPPDDETLWEGRRDEIERYVDRIV